MGRQGNACASGEIGVRIKPNTQIKLHAVCQQAITDTILAPSDNANRAAKFTCMQIMDAQHGMIAHRRDVYI